MPCVVWITSCRLTVIFPQTHTMKIKDRKALPHIFKNLTGKLVQMALLGLNESLEKEDCWPVEVFCLNIAYLGLTSSSC